MSRRSPPVPAPLSIGDVAREAEVAASAIRYWEEQGLIAPVARRGGRRVYDDAVLDRVALVRLAQGAGFTLPEIRTLIGGFPPRASAGARWRALVGHKQADVRTRIEELRRMLDVLDALAACDCPDLDACGAAVRGRRSSGSLVPSSPIEELAAPAPGGARRRPRGATGMAPGAPRSRAQRRGRWASVEVDE